MRGMVGTTLAAGFTTKGLEHRQSLGPEALCIVGSAQLNSRKIGF